MEILFWHQFDCAFIKVVRLRNRCATYHTKNSGWKPRYRTADTRSNSNLRAHEKTHLNLKPFRCQQCPSAFTQKKPLQTHERIHLGLKPFKCQKCHSAFTEKGSLRRHEMTHLDIKPAYQINYLIKDC